MPSLATIMTKHRGTELISINVRQYHKHYLLNSWLNWFYVQCFMYLMTLKRKVLFTGTLF